MRAEARLLVTVALLVGVATQWTGCSYLRSAAAGGGAALATSRHDDLELVSQAVPTYLILLEGLIEGSPKDRSLRISAAEAYTSYASLVEADDPKRASRLYGRAKTQGQTALSLNKKIAPPLSGTFADFSRIPDQLDKRDLRLVFWVASSWRAWITANLDSLGAIAELPRVILLMEWVLEQDESFLHGNPHIFLGMYHAALPPALGGKPEESRRHFERALELSDEQSLMAFVQMARFYAHHVFDRELYDRLLRRALESRVDAIPELTLQNTAAQRMARRLLEQGMSSSEYHRKPLCLALLAACLTAQLGAAPAVDAQPHVLKIASLAPEGSSWINTLRAIDAEHRDKTDGAVRFRPTQALLPRG